MAALAHGVRQDRFLIASDGTKLAWQQVCTRRSDTSEIELVRLDPDSERGHGRGSLNRRNFLMWYENAGISKATLDAGKSVGGYFWRVHWRWHPARD